MPHHRPLHGAPACRNAATVTSGVLLPLTGLLLAVCGFGLLLAWAADLAAMTEAAGEEETRARAAVLAWDPGSSRRTARLGLRVDEPGRGARNGLPQAVASAPGPWRPPTAVPPRPGERFSGEGPRPDPLRPLTSPPRQPGRPGTSMLHVGASVVLARPLDLRLDLAQMAAQARR